MTQLIPASFNCTGLFIGVSSTFTPSGLTDNQIPDFTGECSRIFKIGILCCDLNPVLHCFMQSKEIDARRGDHDICATIRVDEPPSIRSAYQRQG
jgi:hypothetical protein